MNKLCIAAAAALLATGTTQAAPAVGEARIGVELEAVEHFSALGRMHSWYAIDNDTLIVWARAFDPYVIELSQPNPALRFARIIGVTESVGRVHSRFDSVVVDGFRHRIDAIYRLSAEDAKLLKANAAR